MNTELHSIYSMGGKEVKVPGGTKMALRKGNLPGTVTIRIQLPGQERAVQFANLAIRDGVLTIPVPLVFLCHAKEDFEEVSALSTRLWNDSVVTWLDKKDLLPGDDWRGEIEQAIERADRVIVFLSPSSVTKRGFVQREMKYALDQMQLRPVGERYIIPVLLENCEVPSEFRDIHWLKSWEEGWYETLLRALRG